LPRTLTRVGRWPTHRTGVFSRAPRSVITLLRPNLRRPLWRARALIIRRSPDAVGPSHHRGRAPSGSRSSVGPSEEGLMERISAKEGQVRRVAAAMLRSDHAAYQRPEGSGVLRCRLSAGVALERRSGAEWSRVRCSFWSKGEALVPASTSALLRQANGRRDAKGYACARVGERGSPRIRAWWREADADAFAGAGASGRLSARSRSRIAASARNISAANSYCRRARSWACAAFLRRLAASPAARFASLVTTASVAHHPRSGMAANPAKADPQLPRSRSTRARPRKWPRFPGRVC
jgi:hypothetical protein